MPYSGSAAVDAHFVPKRNFISPIFLIAGIPAMMRYTVMSSTNATVIRPNMRNIIWIISSVSFLCLSAKDLLFFTVTAFLFLIITADRSRTTPCLPPFLLFESVSGYCACLRDD